ncbi:MAG: hypothetical protein HND48_16310 [Chloroflexi bacterium]|nr:hypothetical protein [Chloroflexota bacterium]
MIGIDTAAAPAVVRAHVDQTFRIVHAALGVLGLDLAVPSAGGRGRVVQRHDLDRETCRPHAVMVGEIMLRAPSSRR